MNSNFLNQLGQRLNERAEQSRQAQDAVNAFSDARSDLSDLSRDEQRQFDALLAVRDRLSAQVEELAGVLGMANRA